MKAKRPSKTGIRKPKATAAIVRQRTEDILRVLLDGAQPWDIRAYVAECEQAGEPSCWAIPPGGKPLSVKQVSRYVRAAGKLIEQSCSADRERLLTEHIAKRHTLHARAVAAGDHRTALAVLRDLAELQGMYPPRKTELTGKDGAALAVSAVQATTDPERLERVRRLISVAAARRQARQPAALPYSEKNNGAAGHQADGAGGIDDA
jgi:hypothetical protein